MKNQDFTITHVLLAIIAVVMSFIVAILLYLSVQVEHLYHYQAERDWCYQMQADPATAYGHCQVERDEDGVYRWYLQPLQSNQSNQSKEL